MEKVRKIFLWFVLLTKRLYKRPLFIIIMLLIPVLTVSYVLITSEENGVMFIAVAAEDINDKYALDVMGSLKESSRLLKFTECESEKSAIDLVKAGKADCAWIFPEDMQNKVCKFVLSKSGEDAIVHVIQREESVTLRLAREKLSGILYKYCTKQMYLDYAHENPEIFGRISDSDLLKYYDNAFVDDKLFDYYGLSGDKNSADAGNYLLSPIRGILGILIAISALSCSMYYYNDNDSGTFSLVPLRYRSCAEWICQMVSAANVTLAVTLAIILSGLFSNCAREILTAVLYCFCVSSFAMLLRRLCVKCETMGTLLPLLIVLMCIICPVFFDIGKLRALQYILPPTYYVKSIYLGKFIVYSVIYTLFMHGVCFLIDFIGEKKH